MQGLGKRNPSLSHFICLVYARHPPLYGSYTRILQLFFFVASFYSFRREIWVIVARFGGWGRRFWCPQARGGEISRVMSPPLRGFSDYWGALCNQRIRSVVLYGTLEVSISGLWNFCEIARNGVCMKGEIDGPVMYERLRRRSHWKFKFIEITICEIPSGRVRRNICT